VYSEDIARISCRERRGIKRYPFKEGRERTPYKKRTGADAGYAQSQTGK
jgi:hypothetical protein